MPKIQDRVANFKIMENIQFEHEGMTYLVTSPDTVTLINGKNGDVVIPSSINYEDKNYQVTAIFEGAFIDCKGLTSVVVPESVVGFAQEINGDETSKSLYETFSDLPELESVKLDGPCVMELNDRDFHHCIGLKTVQFPSSLRMIHGEPFYCCFNIEKVIVTSPQPPRVGGNPFLNYPKVMLDGKTFAGGKSVTVHVPANSLDAYKRDAYWSQFNIEAIS